MKRVILVEAHEQYQSLYNHRTVIMRDTETGFGDVVKQPSTDDSWPHLNAMADGWRELQRAFSSFYVTPCTRESDGIHFEYLHGTSREKRILQAAKNGLEALLDEFRSYLALLEPKPENCCAFEPTETFENIFGNGRAFLGEPAYRVCSVDMIPGNVIDMDDGRVGLIDYEWLLHVPVPVRLLKYRAVIITCGDHPELSRAYDRQKLAEMLGLADPDGACFAACLAFGNHVLSQHSGTPQALFDQYIKPSYDMQGINYQVMMERDDALHNLPTLQAQNAALEVRSKALESELQYTQDQLLLAWNSRSWKLTRPLRFITRVRAEGGNVFAKGWKKLTNKNG